MAAPDPDEVDILAAEYVLGVLTAEERAVVEQRLARDKAFSMLVAGWERRLSPLALTIPPEAPPPQVWWNVARTLGRSGGQARGSSWGRVGLWRGWALAASVAALLLAGYVALRPQLAGPSLVAVLLDQQAQPAWLVNASLDSERLRARPLAPAPVGDRVQELWVLPPGQSPVTLGVLEGGQVTARALAAEQARLLAAGAAVAVTLEPPGGAPAGKPTGPVVYKGVLIDNP